MKFGVIIFPGSNCDKDMLHVLGKVLEQEVCEIWHKEESLDTFSLEDCICLPGGFSYGDYLRTGAIARFSPVMNAVTNFAKKGGKVFGICNGFQILCEAGLLPGALLLNKNQRFICKNTNIKCMTPNSALTSAINKDEILKIPIAHADGRYFADSKTIEQLKKHYQILFKYCGENRQTDNDHNPNGSIENIAGICNRKRNVFGMMPHPERASEQVLGNNDGVRLFESLLQTEIA